MAKYRLRQYTIKTLMLIMLGVCVYCLEIKEINKLGESTTITKKIWDSKFDSQKSQKQA